MRSAFQVMGIALVLAAVLGSVRAFASSADSLPQLRVVPSVDLARYQGLWYEIARFPNRFQKNCEGATAEYRMRDDGKVDVLNTCQESESGKIRSVRGVARVVDEDTRAKLKVSFLPRWLRFLPFAGDYWVIDLDADYRYAVVSEPKREFMWILARSPSLPRDVYERILERAREQGLDVSKLIPSRAGSVEDAPALSASRR